MRKHGCESFSTLPISRDNLPSLHLVTSTFSSTIVNLAPLSSSFPSPYPTTEPSPFFPFSTDKPLISKEDTVPTEPNLSSFLLSCVPARTPGRHEKHPHASFTLTLEGEVEGGGGGKGQRVLLIPSTQVGGE